MGAGGPTLAGYGDKNMLWGGFSGHTVMDELKLSSSKGRYTYFHFVPFDISCSWHWAVQRGGKVLSFR